MTPVALDKPPGNFFPSSSPIKSNRLDTGIREVCHLNVPPMLADRASHLVIATLGTNPNSARWNKLMGKEHPDGSSVPALSPARAFSQD
jgi:hypothetical protein